MAAKKVDTFIIGLSQCGDVSQLVVEEDVRVFRSLADAKKNTETVLDKLMDEGCERPDRDGRIFIFKIVAEAQVGGIVWKD